MHPVLGLPWLELLHRFDWTRSLTVESHRFEIALVVIENHAGYDQSLFYRIAFGDPYMAALVRERFANVDRVKVLQEDFTRCHIRSHMFSFVEGERLLDAKSPHAKVVSNIPFNISTDVIKQLLPLGDIFSEVILLLQEEAALRFVDSSSRTSEYRPINIFINFYSDPEYKFKVPRTNFFPQPKVDAAIVAFRLKQSVDYPPISSTKSFFSMGTDNMHLSLLD
ncbi:unnamed protein product [Ilex paraguariensis]|uniref:rRNA adenine N(6)-methyltransferase n=1 Tax=Ilex paraguariensis TaxID=185542 RepID=A0ABC8RQF6_9AQUA